MTKEEAQNLINEIKKDFDIQVKIVGEYGGVEQIVLTNLDDCRVIEKFHNFIRNNTRVE